MKKTFNIVEIKSAAKAGRQPLRALDHSLRLKILQHLHQHGVANVSSIYRTLQIEQSVASQHLGVLRKEKMVISERDGQNIFYSVNYDRIQDVIGVAKKLK